jgi:predicted Zn-dependent protease
MAIDPYGNQATPRRRGFGFGGIRWWVLLLFAGYAAYYWISNRVDDPLTGEKVLIDQSITPEDEKALGLQAWNELQQTERVLPPTDPNARAVKSIADRLIAKIPAVSDALAAEHNMQAPHIERTFDWDVNLIQSDQVNAFCLPGGKMAVYTGLIPVAQNENAMAVVMGHEITHALLRHGAQRMSEQKLAQMGQMAGAMSGMDQGQMQAVMAVYGYGRALPYARKQETQADEMGLMLAAAACFDPQEAIPLWQRMDEASGGQAPPEFSSTHPNPGTRIQNLQALMPKAMEYRQKFCETAR